MIFTDFSGLGKWPCTWMKESDFRLTHSTPCSWHSILGLQNVPAPYFSTAMSVCCHLLRSFNLSLKNHHCLAIKAYKLYSSEPKILACDLNAQAADVENFSENTEMQNWDWDRFLLNCFKPSVKAEPAKELHQISKHLQGFNNLASKDRDSTEFLRNLTNLSSPSCPRWLFYAELITSD